MGKNINYIKKNAKQHTNRLPNAKHIMLTDGRIIISIVGGASGLYGDFKTTFEVAIIDTLNGEFITKFFVPDISDDVIPYMSSEELENLIETLFPKGFREH